jgi:hypothetical protein
LKKESICGITLERYAELCAKMNDVISNKEECIRVARSEGIKISDWESAHKGWQERITDPADMGKTASRFVDIWNRATGNNNQRTGFRKD